RRLVLLPLRRRRRPDQLRDAPREARLPGRLRAPGRDGAAADKRSERLSAPGPPGRPALGSAEPRGAGRDEHGAGRLRRPSVAPAGRARLPERAGRPRLADPPLRARLRRRALARGVPAAPLLAPGRRAARPAAPARRRRRRWLLPRAARRPDRRP